MTTTSEILRALHTPARGLLVLPNVWDAGSARAVAEAGYPAIATSSAAVARSRGHEDGERMPVDVAFGAVGEVVQATDLPTTADMEGGYGLDPAEFADRLLATGAVGCNYEDTDHANPGALLPAEHQAERIAAMKAVAGERLVVNARVDTFVRQQGTPDEQLAEGIRRACLYFEAGADCVYPITLSDDEAIAAFVQAVAGPVNILCSPQDPPLVRMAELGVRRVSFGSGFYRLAMQAFAQGVADLPALQLGTDGALGSSDRK